MAPLRRRPVGFLAGWHRVTERPAWNRRTAAGSRLAAAAAGQEPAKGKLEAGLLFSVGPGGFVYLGAERLTTRVFGCGNSGLGWVQLLF